MSVMVTHGWAYAIRDWPNDFQVIADSPEACIEGYWLVSRHASLSPGIDWSAYMAQMLEFADWPERLENYGGVIRVVPA